MRFKRGGLKMKKTAAVLLLLLISMIPAFLSADDIKFLAGVSLANYRSVSGSYPVSPQAQTRFIAGIGLVIPFYWGQYTDEAKVLGEFDILFIQKGCRADTGGLKGDFNLDEISVPLTWKFKFSSGTSPFIMAGAEAAYVISYENKDTGTLDLKPEISSFDYGLILGGGFQLMLDSFKGEIEIRYHYGLADLGKDEADSHFKTSTIVVAAGFIF